MSIFSQQHICRLHITMYNAVTMRASQSFGSLDDKINSFRNSQRTLFQTIFEGSAFDILHNDKGDVLLFSKIMNLDDIWMCQFRNRTRFLSEPFHKNWISRMIRGQNLDSDIAIKGWLIGFKDRGHTTRANVFDNSELAK